MARLHDHLRFFVRSKMSNDPAWQKLKVVYSGYSVPGEGEHKIMEFIRMQVRLPM
jgi:5'-3' exoribonuclease 1